MIPKRFIHPRQRHEYLCGSKVSCFEIYNFEVICQKSQKSKEVKTYLDYSYVFSFTQTYVLFQRKRVQLTFSSLDRFNLHLILHFFMAKW